MTPYAKHQNGSPSASHGDRRGYTLIEALTVIVILGLLAGVAIPRSGVSRYSTLR